MPPAWTTRADALLAKHADEDGRFHYEGEGLPQALEEILAEIAEQDPRGFRTADDELAFLLNAYNLAALAIAARWYARSPRIRRHGLRRWWARFPFFFLARVRIARRRRTLFGLEFFTIRRRFGDPRVHFALVCATNACPPLRHGLYSGSRLNEELEDAAASFMQPGIGYSLDRENNRIVFSRIIRWYAKDFEKIGGPLRLVERWGPAADAEYVGEHRPEVRFAKYDWRLNQAGSSADPSSGRARTPKHPSARTTKNRRRRPT